MNYPSIFKNVGKNIIDTIFLKPVRSYPPDDKWVTNMSRQFTKINAKRVTNL